MSDDNIVTFGGNNSKATPKEDETQFVAVCLECRCRTFNCFADGTIKCSFCDTPLHVGNHNDEQWRRVIPGLPADTSNIEDESSRTVTKNDMPDASMARRRTIKSLSDWSTSGHLCFVGGYNLSGEGRYWLDINTEEQRQWVLEKLAEMIHFVSDADIETTNELQIIPINKDGNNV